MEQGHEEKAPAQESARGGARAAGWPSAQRGQKTRQQGERAQARPGKEPQEDYRGAAQGPPSAAKAPQANLNAIVALIRARFGVCAISLGAGGIRYSATILR
jgi:hypothetical protein